MLSRRSRQGKILANLNFEYQLLKWIIIYFIYGCHRNGCMLLKNQQGGNGASNGRKEHKHIQRSETWNKYLEYNLNNLKHQLDVRKWVGQQNDKTKMQQHLQ